MLPRGCPLASNTGDDSFYFLPGRGSSRCLGANGNDTQDWNSEESGAKNLVPLAALSEIHCSVAVATALASEESYA